jgi:hemolysin activation/secretion protein
MRFRLPKKAAALFCALMSLSGTGSFAHAQDVPRFPVARFSVQGNTLLPQGELEAVVLPFVGEKRDFGDVQRAMEALEALYKQHGFTTVSVQLPEQVLDKGEVLLKVVEGRLKDLRIKGLDFYDEDNVRASLPTLKPGLPPRIDDVSANLRIANENPAKKILLRLQPGETDDEIFAQIDVQDERPWKIGLTLDNTGSAQTGRNRFGLSFQHANLWNRDHILTAQYQTSPERPGEVHVYSLSYRAPLYGLGDAIDFFVTQSNVNAGTIAAGPLNLAITGSGKTYGTRYTLNLKRQGNYEQQLVFGGDYKQSLSDIGAGAVQLGNEIIVRPVSLQYNGRWEIDKSEISLFASVARNLPGGSKGEQVDFDKARLGAPADFSVARYGLTASHAYASDWQVKFLASGQWAPRPLVPGEQFGIGGNSSLRGFGEREISNDKGIQASLEAYTPELCQSLGAEQRCRLLAFYDNGTVFRIDPLVGEKRRETAASFGFGVRYTLGKNVAFQTDYGRVLQGGGERERGDWRIHGRLGVFF